MSYTITLTNGTIKTTVVDGSVDQLSTDLTLIGKNTSGYGIFYNENLIKLLENFANQTQPNYPLKGQLWYDTTQHRLKVYNGSQFVVSGGTIVSATPPSQIAAGDLWIDSTRQQLYFNDGLSTVLAGPIYTKTQGSSGFIVEDILDTNQLQHTVVYLFVAQVLIGIFSKDAFMPLNAIGGITGTIKTGFNASNTPGLSFNVPVTSSSTLIAADGTLKTAESFLSTTDSSQSVGTLSIQNATPLVLGPSGNFEFNVNSGLFQIKSNSTNQNFQIGIKNSSSNALLPAVYVDASSQRVGIFTNAPSSTLNINGDVTVEGNLNVKGTTLIPLAITLTAGARSNSQLATDFLSKVFPNTEHSDNTVCRVVVTDDSSIRLFTLQSGVWTYQRTL